MATPGAPALNLAKLSLPARIGVGAVFVVLVALTYWVMFYTDVSSKIESSKTGSSQLNADLATQQQAQLDRPVDRGGHHSTSSSSSMRDISSGAWTPRMARALARPIRLASANQSRAWVRAASSEITRQSR